MAACGHQSGGHSSYSSRALEDSPRGAARGHTDSREGAMASEALSPVALTMAAPEAGLVATTTSHKANMGML